MPDRVRYREGRTMTTKSLLYENDWFHSWVSSSAVAPITISMRMGRRGFSTWPSWSDWARLARPSARVCQGEPGVSSHPRPILQHLGKWFATFT